MSSLTAVKNGKTAAPYTRLPQADGGFKRLPDGDFMDASRQMAKRPASDAVWSVEEYCALAQATRKRGREATLPWDGFSAVVHDDKAALLGGAGKPAVLSHHALGQLAARMGAPASYLRTLPPRLAVECLQYGIVSGTAASDRNDAKLLLDIGPAGLTVRAITTTSYDRYWDAEQAERIAALCARSAWGPAVSFKRPGGERPAHAWGATAPLPLGWVSDRDSYIVLVDQDTKIRLNGNNYSRFLILRNSEVGAASYEIIFGLMDFICCNFILWGATQIHSVSLQHRGKGIAEKIRIAFGALGATRALSGGEVHDLEVKALTASTTMLGATREAAIARTRVVTGLTIEHVTEGYERAVLTERYGSPRSVWGMVNGLTEASQHRTGFAGDRVDADRAASALLDLVK